MTEKTLNPLRFSATPRARPARVEKPAVSPLDAQVNELLILWRRYRKGYQHGRGWSGSDATCRDYSTPTHWDWKNGAQEDRVDEQLARGVDNAIERIPNAPHAWKTAIEFEAMNLSSGAAVWTSHSLPRDAAELAVLRLEARNLLIRELRAEGCLTGD